MIEYQIDTILLPKEIFVRLGVLKFHMAHVDVHERGAGIKIFCLRRNDRDCVCTTLANVSCSSNAADPVANNDNALHQ